ncbi:MULTISPECIES: DUF1302 family protein [unclassified Pseudomonas]|uniref:DUF1302 family protein n=1 Tax=unclassified Pseudomonas TaxID=196821 RepID=UPI001C47AFDD|nr:MULTISPECIES: DUF1302 family protein [unclassified Pseudomonas]
MTTCRWSHVVGRSWFPRVAANNDDKALYPVGKTAHAQVSWVALLSPGSFWDGGSFIGEIAWNRLLSVSKNREALEPSASRDASALRMVFEPSYYQVFSGLDVSLPVGLGYGISGRSSVINPGSLWSTAGISASGSIRPISGSGK